MFGPKDQTEEIINLIWNPDVYYLVTAGKVRALEKGTERTCFALRCHAAE